MEQELGRLLTLPDNDFIFKGGRIVDFSLLLTLIENDFSFKEG